MTLACHTMGHGYATVQGRATNRCVYCGRRAQLFAGRMQRRRDRKDTK